MVLTPCKAQRADSQPLDVETVGSGVCKGTSGGGRGGSASQQDLKATQSLKKVRNVVEKKCSEFVWSLAQKSLRFPTLLGTKFRKFRKKFRNSKKIQKFRIFF